MFAKQKEQFAGLPRSRSNKKMAPKTGNNRQKLAGKRIFCLFVVLFFATMAFVAGQKGDRQSRKRATKRPPCGRPRSRESGLKQFAIQLTEKSCTDIAEYLASNDPSAWIFFRHSFHKCSSRVYSQLRRSFSSLFHLTTSKMQIAAKL